ncbi:tyrosine-type recombinase/integrase [Variovorax sp. ZT4R33]|uniref:tyrosine-type recombinase/integrase n=1 Tax=Variovorax sp. ZT4R33 TaxID=3443743 RepID=UPI003F454E67
MGQRTRGIYPDKDGTWQVDKWWRGTRFRQRGCVSFEEAERWLIAQLAAKREVVIHGARAVRTFKATAAHYLTTHQAKASIETEIFMLKSVMPTIGSLELHQVHDSTLAPYISARLAGGRAHKTVNLALGVVRRILNLAATSWRDEDGRTWLPQAPKITMLPLVGHQREPRPITWGEQRALLPKLPDHLARMSLFVLNTGVRDDVACSLRWEWEIKVPELGISVFEVPRQHVKGKKQSRVVVCNSVAQSVVDAVRGQHAEFVFVYRRERVKNVDQAPLMAYRPIRTMNNTAWQRARQEAGLGDLHVHDLRHTVGMRLREAGVAEGTISDLLWHSTGSMTRHYSVAQLQELHGALEKVKADSGRWNKSLATLRREQEEGRRVDASPPEVPQKKMA